MAKLNTAKAPKPAATGKTGAKAASSEESAAFEVCQNLWGHGNLSPLDDPFESRALVSLTPNKKTKLGFVGRHMGRRLQRYSKESKLWIDVFEGEPELSRLVKEKDAKITFNAWENKPSLMGSGKFTDIIACQTSQLADPLAEVYAHIGKSLRPDGRLFHGDLMLTAPLPLGGPLVLQRLKPLEEHKEALKAAGLRTSEEVDVTKEIAGKIRNGFQASTEKLAEIRSLEEPFKRQMTVAYGAQLETWATIALLIDAGKITARVMLAAKG